MRYAESSSAYVSGKREYKDGDFVEVIWSKNHRIVEEPWLDMLKDAPSSPHVKAGSSIKGYVLENDDGFWLDIFNHKTFNHSFIWLSKPDWVTKVYQNAR